MTKKLLLVSCLLLMIIGITACEKKEKEKVKEEEKVVTEEITEGTIEGYHFKETDEQTDRVKIQMENGDIILIVLSNKDTPITIQNFKDLVSQKYYDGLIFHRVIKNFMIQGGDITGTGYGSGNETQIKGEFAANGVKNDMSHTRGVISMARGNDMDSASTQFFIVHKDYPSLDGQYASFGKVFAGMDTVDKIAEVKTDNHDRPEKEQKIKSIRFIELIKED